MSEHFSVSSGAGAAWPSLDSLPAGPPPITGPPGGPPPAPPSVPPPLPTSGFSGSAAPPPTPPGRARRRWYLASAFVAVFAILVAAAIVGYRAGQTTEAVAPTTVTTATTVPAPTTTTTEATTTTEEPTTSTTEETTTTTAPATGPSDPQQERVDAEVATLQEYVERARGLEFKQPVKVKALEDKAFVARLKEVSDKDRKPDEEAKANDFFHALGLLPLDVDYRQALEKAEAGAVGGFYNPEDKELVVRGADISPYERAVIVHELVHALDDQHFDLDREFEDAKDESGMGFSALVEGNARRIENEYVDQLSANDKRQYDKRQAEGSADADLSGIPRALLVLLIAPYDYGEELVQTQLSRGGQSALDADYADPPTTSEQFMHPSKYLDREKADPVAKPPSDGPVIDDGVIGELGVQLMLAEAVGTRDAATAAAGWGGDWSVLYSQGRNVCARIDIVMDSTGDLQELKEAFEQWATDEQGRTVTSPDAGRLRVTSCVPK